MKPIFGNALYRKNIEREKKFMRKSARFGAQGIVLSLLSFGLWCLTPNDEMLLLYGSTILACFLLGCTLLTIGVAGYAAKLLEEWTMPRLEQYIRQKFGGKV